MVALPLAPLCTCASTVLCLTDDGERPRPRQRPWRTDSWVPNPSRWCSAARVLGLLAHVRCLLTALINETAAFAAPVYLSQKISRMVLRFRPHRGACPRMTPAWGGHKGSRCTRRYGSLFTIAHSRCSPVYPGLHRSSSHYRGARGPQETHHDRGFWTWYSYIGTKICLGARTEAAARRPN